MFESVKGTLWFAYYVSPLGWCFDREKNKLARSLFWTDDATYKKVLHS